MKPFYVKHRTEEEVREIIEIAVANGANEDETVGNADWGYWKYVGVDKYNDTLFSCYVEQYGENATEMTIEEVREMFEKKSDVSDEWIPERNEECLAKVDGISEEFTVIFVTMYGDDALVVIPSADSRPARYKLNWLRPLKTKDEVERDNEIIILQKVLMQAGVADAHFISEKLHKANCRVLAPDEVIVKPLSDEQIDAIRSKQQNCGYKFSLNLVRLVQREQGVIS